jgi:hypothetical protein
MRSHLAWSKADKSTKRKVEKIVNGTDRRKRRVQFTRGFKGHFKYQDI